MADLDHKQGFVHEARCFVSGPSQCNARMDARQAGLKREEVNMDHLTINAWQTVAKRSALTITLALALLLALLVTVAPAALAQGSTAATGVLERAAPHIPDPTPVYAITDEATGTAYELVSGFADLEQYVGERVTIQGVPVPGPGDPNRPPLLNVTQIEPAGGTGDGGDDEDPPPGSVNDKATLSFELTVFGDPPADAAFYGHVHTGEGGPGRYVPLTDPDEDRVYTGSTIVDRFGPGPRPVPPGVEPVSFPVRIVQDYSEVIKDFGTVKLDGDKTFEAEVSFPVDDCPIISPTPEQCGDSGSGDGDDSGSGGGSGSGGNSGDNGGGSSSGAGSGSSGSPDGGSSGDNGSGAVGSSSSGSVGSSGSEAPGGVANGLRGVLPSTGGGTALWVLGAGALLAGGGFLIRRLAR